MKKKILIAIVVLILISLFGTLFFFIYNKDSNKLRRYLMENNYNCNSTICSKAVKDTQYYMNFKTGYYKIENNTVITFEKEHLTLTNINNTVNCVYEASKDDVNKTVITPRDEESYECRDNLDIISQEYENYQDIFVKAKVNISKLK